MQNKKAYIPALCCLAVFVMFTILVKTVDVKQIGPLASSVGFASLNGAVAKSLPFNESAYKVTQFMGYIALLVCAGFACVGAMQLIKRRSLKEVDPEIISQGVFYVVVIVLYFFFEKVVINYRPVDLGEGLEASYPSSHTMLVICVFATAVLQIGRLVKSRRFKIFLDMMCLLFIVVMITGRIISGVHWLTDIIGGILLSAALVSAYFAYFGTHRQAKK